jgi:hypothetical protein
MSRRRVSRPEKRDLNVLAFQMRFRHVLISRGPLLGFGLEAVEIIHGLLRMCCGAEDGALVVLQHR